MPQVASIQRGTRSVVAADGTSFVIALGAEVDDSSSIVLHSSSVPSGTSRDYRHIVTMELEASGGASAGHYDQIRVRRNSAASAATFSVAWEVIEFDPATLGANGVTWGRDSAFSAGGTVSKTIAVTDVDSAVCLLSWSTSSFVTALSDGSVRASITSATNLDLICSAGKAGTIEVVWQVVDFDPADVLVQRGAISVTGNSSTGNSNTATISSVDTTASLLIGNGFCFPTFGTTSTSRYAVGLQLTNSTTVTAYIGQYGGDSGKSVDIGFEVVEFLDGAEVNSGVFAFGTGDTTKTSSAFSPALDVSRAALWPVAPNLGSVDPKNTNPGGTGAVTFQQVLDITTDVDSLTATRAVTGVAVDTYWQVIEFAAPGGGGGQTADMTAGMSASASLVASAATLAALTSAIGAGETLSAAAGGHGTHTAGLAAGDAYAAAASTIGTVTFGATSGATWSALAGAFATLSDGAAQSMVAATSPLETADMSAGTALGAGFAATSAALAGVSTPLTATDVMAAVAAAVAQLTAGAELTATWIAQTEITTDGVALYATVSVVPALQADASVGPALTATVKVTPALRGRIQLH